MKNLILTLCIVFSYTFLKAQTKIIEQLNYKYLSEKLTVTKYKNNLYQLKHNNSLYEITIVSNTNNVRSMYIGKCLKNCPSKVFITKIVFTKNNESVKVIFTNGVIKQFKK